MPANPTVLTGNAEWLSPHYIIDGAHEVMGGIDVDPCAHRDWWYGVGAAVNYTVDDDGLSQPWHGRVYMNPPYSRRLVDRFVSKLGRELEYGPATSAIVLVNAAVDTIWFRQLAAWSDIIGFTRSRLHFIRPETAQPARGAGNCGQALIGIGVSPWRFRQAFSNHCWLAQARL